MEKDASGTDLGRCGEGAVFSPGKKLSSQQAVLLKELMGNFLSAFPFNVHLAVHIRHRFFIDPAIQL